MVLRLIADRADEIPEALRGGATEKDGRWFAELGNHSVENVTGLKESLVTERSARKKLDGLAKSFGWALSEDGSKWINEGVDPAGARDAFEKVRAGTLKGSEEVERWKRSVEEKLSGDRQRMEAGLQKLKDRVRQAMVVDPIRTAIRDHGGSVSLLAPVVERAVRVEFDDEFNVSIALLNEQGRPMLTKKSGSTDPMGIDEYVQDLRKHPEYRAAFVGTGAGGSGFSSQNGGSVRAPRGGGDITHMEPRELMKRGYEQSTSRAV